MLTLSGRRRSRFGEAGIVGANLVVVIAFALYAVIQLSRVTLAAQQIDDRVEVIIGEVGPIDNELDQVAKLEETNRIAAGILEAAKPLSGQLDQVIAAAQSIDGSVSNIQGNASDINGTVKSINGSLQTLQPVVRQINGGVAAINGRADVIIEAVRGIRSDLGNVLAQVGGPGALTTGGTPNIDGHANSIDCNNLVNGGLLGSQGTCSR